MPKNIARWWAGAGFALAVIGLIAFFLLNSTAADKSIRPAPAATVVAQAQTQTSPTPAPATAVPASPSPTPQMAAQAPLVTPVGDEYIALGDSVAYGVGAPFPEQLGYAGVFYDNYLKRVQPNIFYYKNFAIPGETSSSFITRTRNLNQLQRVLDELDAAEKAGRRVNPITLTIGGNDMLEARGKSQEEKNAALDLFDGNFRTILNQLTARTGGKTDIIVTTYYNPYAFSTRGEDEETAWVRRFNETIKKRAGEFKVKVADFFEPVFGREKALTWIGLGDIHPNTNGHALLASMVWRATGYDTRPPTLNLSYSSLPGDSRLIAGQRASFKLNVQKNGFVPAAPDALPGAGMINLASVSLDGGDKITLPPVPARYNKTVSTNSQEFSYLLDTAGLSAGKHSLHFEALDSAGNIGQLDLSFEIA